MHGNDRNLLFQRFQAIDHGRLSRTASGHDLPDFGEPEHLRHAENAFTTLFVDHDYHAGHILALFIDPSEYVKTGLLPRLRKQSPPPKQFAHLFRKR